MWLVSTIICPNCGDKNAEEHLDAGLELKKIICNNCSYKEEYEKESKWIKKEIYSG